MRCGTGVDRRRGRFDQFRREYNDERPHEALQDRPPATLYAPSRRSVPTRMPALEYPGHWEVRLVSCGGYMKWNNRAVFLASALAGQNVALEEVDDGLWTVYFATIALARYDERHRTLQPIATLSEGRSANCAGSAPDVKCKTKK